MKGLSKLVLGIALSTATLGAAVGGAVLSSNHNENEAEAAGSVPSAVYVDISSCQWNNWGASLSNIKAHFFGDKEYTTWPGTAVSSVSVNGTTYGYVAVPSGATKVIFNVWDGGSSQNQTDDLTIPTDGKLLFRVTSYNTSSVQTGSWENLEQRYTSATSPSSSTGRIIFNNSGSAWQYDGKCAVRAWGGSAAVANNASHTPVSASTYVLEWINDKEGTDFDNWYGYVDIPLDVSGFQFVLMDGTGTSIWNYQIGDSYTIAAGCFAKVYYASGDSKTNISISTGGAKDGNAGGSLMATLLSAFNTCSDNTYIGYPNASDINTNFYSHATATAKSTTCTSLGGVSKTVQEHYEGMARRPGSLPASNYVLFNTAKNDISVILIAVSVISGIALTGFGLYFFKKRKSVSK